MLKDYVETSLNAEQVADLLTMAGFEVEGLEEVEGDTVIDIKVMSNRGDGLSVFGLAREVLAKDSTSQPTELYQRAVNGFPLLPGEPTSIETRVTIESEDCRRFAARILEGNCAQSSPELIQKRLTQAGMRPLSLLVDLTNYVMLEVGQPLHAFDFAKLAGGEIVVRKARKGEKMTTLNGIEHELPEFALMICDKEKPNAVAGVMGGLESEVTDATKTVLLESANFVNTSIRKTRKALGLNTEASYRFERSVDPELVVAAGNRFVELLRQADPTFKGGDKVVDVYPQKPEPRTVQVDINRACELLGMEVPLSDAVGYLQRLGFTAEARGNTIIATVPTWRPDVVRDFDLVEEIGRVHGYDQIPETLPIGVTTQGGLSPEAKRVEELRQIALRAGYDEVLSHSLGTTHPLDAGHQRLGPRNPGSPEMALLRNSLLPSLANASKRNGGRNLHLFEIGRVFWQTGGKPVEKVYMSLLSQGNLIPENRANEPIAQADFYSMKGVLCSMLPNVEISVPETPDRRFHPTRQAVIGNLGIFGQIHPDVAEEAGIPADTVLAEIDLTELVNLPTQEVAYKPISRNPSVRRDIAFVISKSLPYAQIENAIELACGDLLERQWLFDIYEGKGIPEGHYSLAVALVLRKFGENFTDEEANQVRAKALAALEVLGAKARV